jgi:hypothetical protein
VPATEQKRVDKVELQQGWFTPPQVAVHGAPSQSVGTEHVPALSQVPAEVPHAAPVSTHTVVLAPAGRAQHPLLQRLPAQQGAPGTPHCPQTAVVAPAGT